MSTRETKKIVLPATKFEVEIKTYITGGEKRQINEILTSGISADMTGQAKGEIPLTLVYKANDKALELLVVSLDGVKGESVIAKINNLPSSDYDALLSAVNLVTNDAEYTEKKTT